MLYFFPVCTVITKYPSILLEDMVLSPSIEIETPDKTAPDFESVTFPSIFPFCANAADIENKNVAISSNDFMPYIFTAKRQLACYANMN